MTSFVVWTVVNSVVWISTVVTDAAELESCKIEVASVVPEDEVDCRIFPGIGMMVVDWLSTCEDTTPVPCCLLSIPPSAFVSGFVTTHRLCSSFARRTMCFLSLWIGPAVARVARRETKIALVTRILRLADRSIFVLIND